MNLHSADHKFSITNNFKTHNNKTNTSPISITDNVYYKNVTIQIIYQ